MLDDAEAHHKPVTLEKDGAPTWYDVRKNPFNTKGTLINYALSDITAEKATSIMAELFFDSIDDFVTIFRKDGRILFVNTQARNGLGYSEREFRLMSVFDFLPEQYHARARQLLKVRGLCKHEFSPFAHQEQWRHRTGRVARLGRRLERRARFVRHGQGNHPVSGDAGQIPKILL